MVKVVFENSDFIVCDKEAGYISEYSPASSISLPKLVCSQLSLKEIYTVHRLDKEVSGLIVYAKNSATANSITRQINEGNFKKEYLAIVSGNLEKEYDKLCDLLYHDKQKNKTYVVKKERLGVKKALLEYNKLDYDSVNNLSKLQIKLLTGRTHQIRVQFASRGHSILGDRKYGSPINVKPIRLHSYLLSFYNPKNGEELTFKSTPNWF